MADQQVAVLALNNAIHEAAQTRPLMARGIVAQDILRKVTPQGQEAQEKLPKANRPVESEQLAVRHRALDLTEHEYALRHQALQTRLADNALPLGQRHSQSKPGMTGQAAIVTTQEPLRTLLLNRLRQTISLGASRSTLGRSL